MTKYAICIGNNHHLDPSITNLRSAVNDARAMGELLQKRLGYQTLVRTDAKVPEMLSCIEDVGRQVQPEDSVLFYFAGHAVAADDQMLLLGVEARSDLLAAGITAGAPGLMGLAALAKLTEPFARCHRLFVLDVCRSATVEEGSRGVPLAAAAHIASSPIYRDITVVKRSKTLAYPLSVLTSCGPGQRAMELADAGHGLFTSCLMDVLEAAANSHTAVDVNQKLVAELNRRIKARMPGVKDIGTASLHGVARSHFALYAPDSALSAR